MRRFEFTPERLLKVKRQKERLAELEQQRARLAVEAAKQRVEELREQLARISQSMTSFVGQAISPHQWATNFDMSNHIDVAMQAALKEVQRTEQIFWEASQERAQVATEVEALQTLKDHQWEQYRLEFAKSEQQRLDDQRSRRSPMDNTSEIQDRAEAITE